MDKLIEKLSKVQIIKNDSDLYRELNAIEGEEWVDLMESLDGAGYTLKYNNLEDCFVIS